MEKRWIAKVDAKRSLGHTSTNGLAPDLHLGLTSFLAHHQFVRRRTGDIHLRELLQ